ncbi:hypothetical protein BS50DRAFT_478313 [Corynespora cassiicola Philippines]|uniref:Autophagy-related protein 27 n=1 Tax=Corynespora cassiicola Philippines TaxID=1448308 RepID=A0A2T2P989_CORCC|nr:hypothetical protein BS50DRAFT_478313 [Corynespora cassiicola Philippines]
MRSQPSSGHPRSLLTLSSLLLLLPSPSFGFACNDILASGVHFDFTKLGGPHSVNWAQDADLENQEQFKYNFTLDICNKLPHHKGRHDECHSGTRVCAIRQTVDLSGRNNTTLTPIDIAGTYKTSNGRSIDAKYELLHNSNSNSDVGREGVRVELHGGRFPYDDTKAGIDQRAIIEFVCDKDRTGLEGDAGGDDGKAKDPNSDDSKDGEDDGNDNDDEKRKLRSRDDASSGKCDESDASLRFCGYGLEDLAKNKKARTLRLEWRTKYACRDAPADNGGSSWGFFTWFIIIVFLAIAAYLIFGSWLNYNRYGARGWDLVPHGDTIRDIPYIIKDLGRRVAHTVQGPGSRGGYSAV